MEPLAETPLETLFQGLVLFSICLAIAGAVAASVRELNVGYWILGWANLLVTGALFLLADGGYPRAAYLAYVTDAIFAPLMYMGAREFAGRDTRYWPLFVGLAAGVLRVGLVLSGASLALVVHGLVFNPAFLTCAAITVFRAQPSIPFRRAIAVLLVPFVLIEFFDAWSDWLDEANHVPWRALIAVCVPLAALQLASRLTSLRADMALAREASEQAELRRELERDRFHAIFDRMTELVAELTADSRILYVNARVRDLIGLDPEEVLGHRALDFVPDALRAEAGEIWRQRLEGNVEPIVFPVDGTGGDRIYLEITVSEQGSTEEDRLLVLARDVSERRRHELALEEHGRLLEERVAERSEELRRSLLRLRDQERLAAIGTLASGIAHQINNPVGAIVAAGEFALLAEGQPDQAKVQQESLQRIVEEAHRAGRIVKSMLRFARHESSAKWREDLADVARRACELTRAYVRDRSGGLSTEIEDVAMPVLMSPIEIEQVVVNLIRNAVESRPEGAAVRLRCGIEEGRALLEVSDDGRGIPLDDQAHVFDPFYTTRLREGGSGLGLSVAHGIVTDHGGEIEVESAVDRGTTVRVRLPLDEEPPVESD